MEAGGSTGSRESERSGRRGFIEVLLGGGLLTLLGTMLYSVSRFVIPPKAGKIFRFGNRPGILVRTAAGDFRAFSATCTHLNCTVQYRPDLEHIWCACHNGHFDLVGKNIAGPPPRPLDPFDVVVRGEDVVVTRKA